MFSNAIHLNSDFFQINHLDKLRQAQGNSEHTYHNYLAVLCMTTFQLNLKGPNVLLT